MKRLIYISVVFALFMLPNIINAQIVERSVEAIEYLQTNDKLIYRGVDIPVLDITYHEFSADSLVWRKDFQTGDCYVRFTNETDNSSNSHPDDSWWVFNFCTCNGAIGGDGTSKIDTIILCDGGVCDTITTGTVTIPLRDPETITGTTLNTKTDSTHTHELILYVGELQDVDSTAKADGYVLKWNETLGTHVYSPDLIAGGASGQLTVKEQDDDPTVTNVNEIRIENGRVTDEGAGAVSIDFSLEPIDGKQDFFRTDTVDVTAGDTFLTFSLPLPANDYIVANAYALYPNGERQSLSYDSTTVNGFRVLSVLGESEVHYLVMRNLDSLGLAVTDQGKILASSSDTNLGYLDSKTDDSTITVVNEQLTVLSAASADSVPEANVYINSSDDISPTLLELNAHTGTQHIEDGCVITDLGDGTISVTACEAYLKTDNDDSAVLKEFVVPSAILTIPTNQNYTLFIDYNAGSPVYKAEAAQTGRFYNNWDELIFGTAVNLGSSIITRNFKDLSIDAVYKLLLRIANTDPIVFLGNGISVSDEGTRQFSTSVGAALFGTEYEVIMPINTSALDTFVRVYYDSGWQRVMGEQTVNNTHYNDTAVGLVALGANKFTDKWLYYVDDAPSYWAVLDGQAQYGSFADAYAITKPLSLPPELNAFYAGAELIGKFIVQEGRTEFSDVQNPFEDNYGVPTPATAKSYSFTSNGILAGTYYAAGFYDVASTDANLTQASTTQTFGGANTSYAAHPFAVAGGAGTVDAGVVGLRVTGTRIQDDGTRTPAYADTIITDITTQSINEYEEAAKFIGTVTYELIVISGTPTTYSFDFNYGLVKYEDFGNSNFDVNGFECVGLAGATDAAFNITLIHHNDEDWTYAATGFTITPTVIADLQTVHNTEYQLTNDDPFAFKLAPIGYPDVIQGSDSEGVVVRIVAGANSSVQSMDIHIGVRIIE